MTLDAILFYALALVALGSALVVVGQRNPVYSAFALIVTMASLSAIFGLLGSPFIAVLQVVVYAGAIMVLFVFVLMLLNVREEQRIEGGSPALRLLAVALGALLAVQVAVVLLRAVREGPAWAGAFDASAQHVARELFTPKYLYVFEATSILIVAALVGAISLARRPGTPPAAASDTAAGRE
jgi:NADH-quinone oxidoreductase subunit J